MIPAGGPLSSAPIVGAFLSPDNRRPKIARQESDTSSYGRCFNEDPADWEMGGVGLNDPSQGSQVKEWAFALEGDDVTVESPTDAPVVLFSAAGITEISGSFDQNMNPNVAYVAAGVAKLWWYDSTISGYTTTTLTGATSPRLTLDDKRRWQVANSDVLLFYLRDGALYYLQQRERYQVERYLQDAPVNTRRLGRVGMSTRNRLQWEFLIAGGATSSALALPTIAARINLASVVGTVSAVLEVAPQDLDGGSPSSTSTMDIDAGSPDVTPSTTLEGGLP